MRAYLAQIVINLKLTLRDRAALFFGYAFPLLFFVVFGQTMGAARGGAAFQVVAMVLVLGVLGNGLFGAGIRAVQEREANILRRFKVAPITAAPILVSSIVNGWIYYMPSVLLILALAHLVYGMPVPARPLSLLAFLSLAILSFRSIGLIIASVVNSAQENQILIQILYMPMLFLSGAVFPQSMLPAWLQTAAQFLPATYLYTGMQGILVRGETLAQQMASVTALLLTLLLATLLGIKLFRWEKDEKLQPAAKAWLAAVLAPFLVLGLTQAYSGDNVRKSKLLEREMRRNRTTLIRGARIFTGDGRVLESSSVLVRNGRIAEIYEGATPDATALDADAVEAAGKTLLPGLIDLHVHLAAPGGIPEAAFDPQAALTRELAAYLFSGVVAVRSAGDPLDWMRQLDRQAGRGDRLGAELNYCGPMFTVEGGHGADSFRAMPGALPGVLERETRRLPSSPQEAQKQIAELKQSGARCVQLVLASAPGALPPNRLDTAIVKAIGDEARRQGLPLVAHTGDARDVRDAIDAGATVIEHGSAREPIPQDALRELAVRNIYYNPTLSVWEAFSSLAAGQTDLLERTLVQQVGPAALIESTRMRLRQRPSGDVGLRRNAYHADLDLAMQNLRQAHALGVPLAAGTDSGHLLILHGPAIHRELQLYVKAGVPGPAALKAATRNAALVLGLQDRLGSIRKGADASLLLVDGNAVQDIAATERISMVFYRGERVSRAGLFEQ